MDIKIYEGKAIALESLPKKELIRLLTLAGMSPKKSEDRQKSLMALRLSRLVENLTLKIEWSASAPELKQNP